MTYLANISTSTLPNQNIGSALLIHTFTNSERPRKVYINVFVDQVAGNGGYKCSITVQRAGAGSAYQSIVTTNTLASGVTSAFFGTVALVVNTTDVVKVYLLGQAGDTTTPDIIVDVWEELPSASGDQMDLIDAPNATALAALDALLSSNHGMDAWGPIGSSGLFTITMTVRDANTLAPLPHVLVLVKDATDITTLYSNRTNAAGLTVPSLDAASYKVHIGSIPGYSSLTADLIVTDNAPAVYNVAPIVIGAPAMPDLCRVYGYEYQDGWPVSGQSVTAELIGLPETSNGTILEGVMQLVTTNVNGYWYFDLVISKQYRIKIIRAKINQVFTVPNQSNLNFETLVE